MSRVDAVKLLGVLCLTPKQKEYLHLAYVLQKANGSVCARGRESAAFKAGMRRLVKFTLATERFPGVFDLNRTGWELGRALEEHRREAKAARVAAGKATRAS